MLFSKACLKNFQYLLQVEEKSVKSSHLHCYSERKTEENINTSSDHRLMQYKNTVKFITLSTRYVKDRDFAKQHSHEAN